MRRALFFAPLLVFGYLGAMYRSVPLMVFFLLGLFLAASMAAEALYLRRRVSLRFSAGQVACLKGETGRICIQVKSRCRLPVSRVKITLSAGYGGRRGRTVRTLSGSVGPREEANWEVQLQPPSCGLLTLALWRVRLFDALGLFSSREENVDTLEIAVYPPERPLAVTCSPVLPERDPLPAGSQSLPRRGEDPPEYLQLRPFQRGDLARQIHWKQSAKTGQLWSREYQRETDIWVHLLVGTAGPRSSGKSRDAFYETLSALLLGLVEAGAAVRLYWREEKEGLRHMDVAAAGDRFSLLWALYHAALLPVDPTGLPENCFTLDTDLNWRRGSALIHRFAETNLLTELRQMHVTIP